ncbi:oxidoreductase [Bordetella ansorpii]|uniref:Oxidoreductase n=1 Tax=Bordetella ansorpii TaxID=288768 RepID=A0A157P587_9BORD|nr:FAD-binding oxidoreductase [Bordetella ansorpii]SAI28129.1 oxidoreductase [Bordetella ansorpii]
MPDDDLKASLRTAFRGRVVEDADALAPHLTDYRKRWTGRALALAQPDSAEDVAALVRWCGQHRVAIYPQGGNTGLVGGSVPDGAGHSIVLSLARMNAILDVDRYNNTLTAQGGAVLATVQDAAAQADRLFPLSLGAEGSCTLGGNLATNAGGIQVLRYGNARDLCLGLEVVTPDGQIWNGLRGLRKDNTGYDLKQLFIGAEGSLGIITAATVKLYPRPAAQMTAFAAVPDAHSAVRLLSLAQSFLSASLTAFELISGPAVELVLHHTPAARSPVPGASPYYVLLESSDAESAAHATERFEALMQAAFETGIVTDAAIASTLAQSAAFWQIRHHLPEAQATDGENIKHDISLPISRIGEFIDAAQAAVHAVLPGARIFVFGHVGDGNLHYNVSTPAGADARAYQAMRASEKNVSAAVYEVVARMNGSISAEHGVGQLRVGSVARYKSAAEMAMMAGIKRLFDPLGLFNPGRVIAAD